MYAIHGMEPLGIESSIHLGHQVVVCSSHLLESGGVIQRGFCYRICSISWVGALISWPDFQGPLEVLGISFGIDGVAAWVTSPGDVSICHRMR